MFITKYRASLVKQLNNICPHSYKGDTKWSMVYDKKSDYYCQVFGPSNYFLTHYRPQIIITLSNDDQLNNSILKLAKAIIKNKIGEIQDGQKNSLKGYCELRRNKLYFWFWNKVSKKSESKKEIEQFKIKLSNDDLNDFVQSAFDHIGTIIGIIRGRWLYKYENGKIVNSKTRDTFMSQDLLKDHKRFFHLQRNASKYCVETIMAIEAIESKFNVSIRIHGQKVEDSKCFSENGYKWYFEDRLEKSKYIETCAYYTFWANQFNDYYQERIYNSTLYIPGHPGYIPHSDLQNYVRVRHYDEDGWYEWEDQYDVDDSQYNEFMQLLHSYFFKYQEEIKAGTKAWPAEFEYPTEPYEYKGYSCDIHDDDDDNDDDDYYDYEEEAERYNRYRDYHEDSDNNYYNDYDNSDDVNYYTYLDDQRLAEVEEEYNFKIDNISHISWKELSFEGIY